MQEIWAIVAAVVLFAAGFLINREENGSKYGTEFGEISLNVLAGVQPDSASGSGVPSSEPDADSA